MLDIEIKTITHYKQRYQTVGDYFKDLGTGTERFRISDMGNKDYEFLVALHELIEQYLSEKRGIKEEEIDQFDINFKGEGEPGDQPNAPYYKEHQFASKIEKLVAEEMSLNWEDYNNTVEEL